MGDRIRAMSIRVAIGGLALLGGACTGGSEGPVETGDRPPDIVLISVDTLNRSALRAFDDEALPVPVLDDLAKVSVRFQNAHTTASWTLPSHGSLFTGLYPDRHGATDGNVTLVQDVATLAGELKRRGYQTVAFNGGGYLHQQYGMGRGFDVYESYERGKQDPAEPAKKLLDRAMEFLDERPADAPPLFLFLHTYSVHNYYDARPEAVRASGLEETLTRKEYIGCVLGRYACPRPVWKDMERLYQAELDLLGEALTGRPQKGAPTADGYGAILPGFFADRVVVLLSDHGEGFAPEEDRLHHGGRLHEDQIRIPLLVHLPGIAPRDEPTPVSLVDVMPTLLEVAGLTPPANLDGRSLLPLLKGQAELEPRPLYAMEHYFTWEDGRRIPSEEVHSLPLELAVIQDGRWLIQSPEGEELYDMGADPRQEENLAESAPDLDALRAVLEARRKPRKETAPRGENETLNADLEALGYGGGE